MPGLTRSEAQRLRWARKHREADALAAATLATHVKEHARVFEQLKDEETGPAIMHGYLRQAEFVRQASDPVEVTLQKLRELAHGR